MDIESNSINYALMFQQNPTEIHKSNSRSIEKQKKDFTNDKKKLILTLKKKKTSN